MLVDDKTLANYKIDENKIVSLGFVLNEGKFVLNKEIFDGEFLLNIEIENNIIRSQVIEVAFGEPFGLYEVSGQGGAFATRMRAKFDEIISKVRDSACSKFIFKCKNSQMVIDYVSKKYGDELEFLWDKFPEYAVIRNKINNKWYAVLMVIKNKNIGITENKEGKIEAVNLAVNPETLPQIIDNKNIFPGFHMNKKYWITLKLDCTLPKEKIYELIDNSYQISIKKAKKQVSVLIKF